MQRYSALVSTTRSGGHVIVDLGEHESLDAAEKYFHSLGLCLRAERIKVDIVETATIDPPEKPESECRT